MASSVRGGKWIDEDRAESLRECLRSKLDAGMRESELPVILGCSRTTAWRFMRGGRLKVRNASLAFNSLISKNYTDPALGSGGFSAALKEWSIASAPHDQRRAIHRMTGFIAELAVLQFGVSEVRICESILANSRPGSPSITYTSQSGVTRRIDIVISKNFALSFMVSDDHGRVIYNGEATPLILGKVLKLALSERKYK